MEKQKLREVQGQPPSGPISLAGRAGPWWQLEGRAEKQGLAGREQASHPLNSSGLQDPEGPGKTRQKEAGVGP